MNTRLYCERQSVNQNASTTPLVCIHGWGMNLRVFDPLRAALQAQHSTWALDLPGHGRSEWHDSRAGLEWQLQDLLAVLPEQCMLLGWSLGGQLALELARLAPQQVRALVLLTTTPRFTQALDWPQGLDAATMSAFRERLSQDWHQTLGDFVQLQVRGSRNAKATQQQLEEALRAHGVPREAALHAGLAMLDMFDQRDELGQILQPTLVLSGQHDRVAPPAAGRWLADALPAARYKQIPRAGHAPHLSHVDDVVAALRGFLHEPDLVVA